MNRKRRQSVTKDVNPSVRIQEIVELIACIPIISYKIKRGDLDACYTPPRFTSYEYASARLAMNKLIDVLDDPNELNNLDYYSECSLEHFMGTVKNYETDSDVEILLRNPVLRNLAFLSVQNE